MRAPFLLLLILTAGCTPEPPPAPAPTPCGLSASQRHDLLATLGRPPRDPDPGATEPGAEPGRWTLRGAEMVWASAPNPDQLHVLFGDAGGTLSPLVAQGHAALWLPPPPERPAANEALLRRAGRPPDWYRLQHAWAAIDAARMARFGPSPSGEVVVHLGPDPFAVTLALLDPRVQRLVGPVDRLPAEPAAQCLYDATPPPPPGPSSVAAPRPDTAPARSPEPAPWSVALRPVAPGEASAKPPEGWTVLGADATDLPQGPGGWTGAGVHGVLALQAALDGGGVAIAQASPVTLWAPPGEAPAWPVDPLSEHYGDVRKDPWWLLTALGPRAVVVDPRDALGRPWAGGDLPVRTAATVEEAAALLSR